MKIKWKIILSFLIILVVMGIAISYETYVSMEHLLLEHTEEELHNYSQVAMEVFENEAEGEWSLVDGQLYKGDLLMNGNEEVQSEVMRMTADSEMIQSLFVMDTRIATSVVDSSGTPQIGTTASDEVIEQVLGNGQTFVGVTQILGTDAMTRYEPIYDASENVVGMWFVGVYVDSMEEEILGAMQSLMGIIAITILIAIPFAYLIGVTIAKGIKRVEDKIKTMEEGGFDFEYSSKELSGKDELAIIARSTSHMKDTIAKIVAIIKQDTSSLRKQSQETLEDVAHINQDLGRISEATEELSASMQETTAFTEELSSATVEMEHEIASMKEKAEEVSNLSVEIRGRAERLNMQSDQSKATALDVYTKTNEQLRHSIENAKSIEKIKELTTTILKITAKTNLLAINASIEAARAGEAGKGFAVVADQICVLADSSKEAVTSITEITELVSLAVNSVVEDSKKLLEFVDGEVMQDYDMLSDTAIQYHNDADSVYQSVTEIVDSTQNLYQKVTQLTSGIEQVTTAALHGAEGTLEIAEQISDIAAKAEDVKDKNIKNQDSINELDGSMEFFQI